MDGQTPRGVGGQHAQGRDLRGGSGALAWPDRCRGRVLAEENFAQRTERAAVPTMRRRRGEGREVKKPKQKIEDLVFDNGILR